MECGVGWGGFHVCVEGWTELCLVRSISRILHLSVFLQLGLLAVELGGGGAGVHLGEARLLVSSATSPGVCWGAAGSGGSWVGTRCRVPCSRHRGNSGLAWSVGCRAGSASCLRLGSRACLAIVPLPGDQGLSVFRSWTKGMTAGQEEVGR